MIDRKKLPDFMQDMPEERLRGLVEEDKTPKMEFNDAINIVLRKNNKNETKSIYKVTSNALISDTIYIAADSVSDVLNKVEKYKKIKKNN